MFASSVSARLRQSRAAGPLGAGTAACKVPFAIVTPGAAKRCTRAFTPKPSPANAPSTYPVAWTAPATPWGHAGPTTGANASTCSASTATCMRSPACPRLPRARRVAPATRTSATTSRTRSRANVPVTLPLTAVPRTTLEGASATRPLDGPRGQELAGRDRRSHRATPSGSPRSERDRDASSWPLRRTRVGRTSRSAPCRRLRRRRPSRESVRGPPACRQRWHRMRVPGPAGERRRRRAGACR